MGRTRFTFFRQQYALKQGAFSWAFLRIPIPKRTPLLFQCTSFLAKKLICILLSGRTETDATRPASGRVFDVLWTRWKCPVRAWLGCWSSQLIRRFIWRIWSDGLISKLEPLLVPFKNQCTLPLIYQGNIRYYPFLNWYYFPFHSRF